MKTQLPQVSVKRPDKCIRQRDAKVKLKRKLYSNKKFGAKQSKSKPGDSVFVKQPKKDKLTPQFNQKPGIITQKKGPMVTVRHSNRTLTRDGAPGRVAQSVTCLATDACLTADPGVASSIPARYHTFVEIDHEIISTVILLPSADLFKKGCCQLQAKVCAQITG